MKTITIQIPDIAYEYLKQTTEFVYKSKHIDNIAIEMIVDSSFAVSILTYMELMQNKEYYEWSEGLLKCSREMHKKFLPEDVNMRMEILHERLIKAVVRGDICLSR